MANGQRIFNWQLYFGFILVITGVLFLADQLLDLHLMRYFWPLLVVLLGLTFIFGMVLAGKRGAGLAIPGSVITVLGLLLFIQNTFNLWVTWTYAWALLIAAAGLGLLLMNFYLKRTGLRRASGLIIGIGLVLFVVFGIVFEVILDIAGTDVQSGFFLGGGLVLLGIFMIFSRSLFKKISSEKVSTRADHIDVVDAAFGDAQAAAQPTMISSEVLPEDAVFTGLHFESLGEVFLLQGDTCDLRIEGDPELLNKITIEVQEDFLQITYQPKVSDWQSLKWIKQSNRIQYFVTIKEIAHINLAGAGSISAEKLSGGNLSIAHSGAGKMSLKALDFTELDVDLSGLGEIQLDGKVMSQNVDLNGGGSYFAEDLQSEQSNIALSGAGSVKIWVEKDLNATLTGAGSIKYKGTPNIVESSTGLGSIKPL